MGRKSASNQCIGFRRYGDKKKRKCLRCQKQFDSQGVGNRICSKCEQSNHSASGLRECRVVVDGRFFTKD
jgi:hypothetical protein